MVKLNIPSQIDTLLNLNSLSSSLPFQKPVPFLETPVTMVNTVDELRIMIDLIKQHSKEIAVDLEVLSVFLILNRTEL